MSKIYKITVRKFKVDPSSLVLTNFTGLDNISTKNKTVTLVFNHNITKADRKKIYDLQEQLDLTEKEEYAALTTDSTKIIFIAEKLGLI